MKALIKHLVETFAPSGSEAAVRELVRKEIEPYVDEIRVDPLGNLLARKFKKDKDGLRVMLSAHMDEIGLVATHIDENGFVRFSNIGGINPLTLAGGRVRFVNGTQGVIWYEKMDNMGVPAIDKMYIDVGVDSRKDCPIKVGNVAAFERPMIEVKDRLISKTMDDRISVAILVELVKELKKSPHEVYFVFSVQEEVGLRGAKTAAYGVDPDLGISVDVTRTGDTPKGIKMDVALGKGPAIKVRDSGMLSDTRLVDALVKTAEKAGIPYQLEVLETGTTDATMMQVSRAGVPSGCISIPCRYIHSPSEMVDYNDVVNVVKLLREFLSDRIQLG